MTEREVYEHKQLTQQLREVKAQNAELRAKLQAAEQRQHVSMRMVPLYVLLPQEVYQELRHRAEEQGRPAAELASLYVWRAIREF